MHLTFGYVVLYTPIYHLTERKNRFQLQTVMMSTRFINCCRCDTRCMFKVLN